MSLTTDESTREPEPSDHALSANDLETLEALINKRQTRRDGWTLLIWAFAAVALFASAVAIGFGMRAIDESKQGGTGAVAAAGGAAQVTLKEFSITPLMISASQSGGIDVVNNGNVEHNLAVQGTDLKTAMIPAGGSAHLDLSGLAAGTYTVFCQVAGHQASGMQAMLHLGEGTTSGLGAGSTRRRRQLVSRDDDVVRADGRRDEGVAHRVPGEDRRARRHRCSRRRCWPTARSSSTSPPR